MSCSSFVGRQGCQFVEGGQPLYVHGFNAYFLMAISVDLQTRSKAVALLEEAASAGLNVARTWAFNDGGYQALQTSPGVYDEKVFQSVLTRMNSITGIQYKDDPTIFAWELINEPQCTKDPSGDTLQAWIEEMAAYLKSIDCNHLLGLGSEGFYGPSNPRRVSSNPNTYALQVGTDFLRNHNVAGIDFAGAHGYPDSWLGSNADALQQVTFIENWLADHIADCTSILKKPFLFGEFGVSSKSSSFKSENRESFLSSIYTVLYISALGNGAGAGGLLWQLFPKGMDNFNDGYQIVLSEDDSVSQLVNQHSQRLQNLAASANEEPKGGTCPIIKFRCW